VAVSSHRVREATRGQQKEQLLVSWLVFSVALFLDFQTVWVQHTLHSNSIAKKKREQSNFSLRYHTLENFTTELYIGC
jgi:hypothetical protein